MSTYAVRPQTPWALRLLPPFPAIAHRILALASQDNSSAPEVGGLIKLDPSFSAELLRFANSALFGVRREVTSLTQAVALMGMERVKSMATFVALNKMVQSSVRTLALRKVWMHSVVTALIVTEAARISRLDRDSAYTAGLLHNLGALGLMSAYPDEYSRMLEVSDDFGFDLLTTERDLFEIDHCEAGSLLAKDWSFPEELRMTIETHHEEPEANQLTIGNLVRVAWRFTDALGYAAFSPARAWEIAELQAFLPHTPNSWLCGTLETAKAEIESKLADSPL
jgi:HD-like signal output (HDOD) protein